MIPHVQLHFQHLLRMAQYKHATSKGQSCKVAYICSASNSVLPEGSFFSILGIFCKYLVAFASSYIQKLSLRVTTDRLMGVTFMTSLSFIILPVRLIVLIP